MKVFGEKMDRFDYRKRIGIYAVIVNPNNEKILTVENARGHYFLPGGGIYINETHEQCLKREMLEETGYEILIGTFVGNAMQYHLSSKGEPILGDGYFYLAKLKDKVQDPTEEDHLMKWFNIKEIENKLFHQHQIWAVKEALSK